MSFRRHLIHYLPLFIILFLGFLGIFVYQYDNSMQKAIIIATSVGYVSWGIVHHKIHDDLSFEVLLEYLFMALIGTAIVFTIV
jgi:hypothetical protein